MVVDSHSPSAIRKVPLNRCDLLPHPAIRFQFTSKMEPLIFCCAGLASRESTADQAVRGIKDLASRIN